LACATSESICGPANALLPRRSGGGRVPARLRRRPRQGGAYGRPLTRPTVGLQTLDTAHRLGARPRQGVCGRRERNCVRACVVRSRYSEYKYHGAARPGSLQAPGRGSITSESTAPHVLRVPLGLVSLRALRVTRRGVFGGGGQASKMLVRPHPHDGMRRQPFYEEPAVLRGCFRLDQPWAVG
jgi:hypothetical protein